MENMNKSNGDEALEFATNDAQQEAIATTEGPLLVLAGAGTGKTTVITKRIAYIVQSGLAQLTEVLAVTFTNKAAKEIYDRTLRELRKAGLHSYGTHFFDSWIGTFHSVCVRILRENVASTKYQPGFVIFAYDEQLKLIKQITNNSTVSKQLLSIISLYKDTHVFSTQKLGDVDVVALYEKYQSELLSHNAMDFGDIINNCCDLLEQNESIRTSYRNKFKYVSVDEYQDTNLTQNNFLKLITNENNNICCVGDDDQCIYTWRGAEVSNILEFESQYPQARIIKIEKNYRSQANILSIAEAIIARNTQRMSKSLIPHIASGTKVKIIEFEDHAQEARHIASVVSGAISQAKTAFQKSNNNIECNDSSTESNHKNAIQADTVTRAILVRTNSQIRPIEEELNKKQVPYQIIGEIRFYDRMEIKDTLAYLRAIIYKDDNIAFIRMMSTPKRGIGPILVDKIKLVASENKSSLQEACELICLGKEGIFSQHMQIAEKHSISSMQVHKILALIKFIQKWRHEVQHGLGIQLLIEGMLKEAGYLEMIAEQDAADASNASLKRADDDSGRFANIKELMKSSAEVVLQFEKEIIAQESADTEIQKPLDSEKEVVENNDNVENYFAGRVNKEESPEHRALFEANRVKAQAIGKFLDNVYFSSHADAAETNKLKIMTIHGAKGLEFDMVFLPGWEEVIIPSIRAIDDGGVRGLEEERRLAYVAITRAKHDLYVSHARSRQILGAWHKMSKSRFLDNMPQNNIEMMSYASHLGLSAPTQERFMHFSQNPLQAKESKPAGSNNKFGRGAIVTHIKFGRGIICSKKGEMIEVNFPCGVKKIMQNFLQSS
jgi:DNA helicase-2/ATP-dependent DNA helicase PcrA